MTRFISGVSDYLPLSRINNFFGVIGAGFCVILAGTLLASGSEAVFHRELPAIGWSAVILLGGKMLVNFSKLKRGQLLIAGLGYLGMFACMMVYVFRG